MDRKEQPNQDQNNDQPQQNFQPNDNKQEHSQMNSSSQHQNQAGSHESQKYEQTRQENQQSAHKNIQITPNHPNSNNIQITPNHPNSNNIQISTSQQTLSNIQLSNSTLKQSEQSNASDQSIHSNQGSQQTNKNIDIQKRASTGSLLFQKNGKKIEIEKKKEQTSKPIITVPDKDGQQQQLPSKSIRPSTSEPSVKVVKNEKKEINMTIKLETYPIEKLINSVKLLPDYRLPHSRGYVTLQNYILEMKNEKHTKNQFNPRSQRQRQNRDATLIATSNTSFQPTVMLKNVNMWDNDSDQAFKMNVNQSFNRLTKDKIDQVLNDLIPKVNTPEREKIVADIFVSKASSEKSFASTYAEFVKELSNTNNSLADSIIADATGKLTDFALNPADETNDFECESSLGYTSFVAALISNQKITNGETYIKTIIDAIPNENINPSLIEMLKNFVLSVGNSFIQTINKSIWSKLETLLNNKNVTSRVHYLIVDTLEIINGTTSEKETPQKVSESSKSLVRNGFASFQDNYTTVPFEVKSLKSQVFFEGSMILFPDIKDVYDFTYYQCFVIKNLGYKKIDIYDTLQKYIRSFAEQELDMDCRYIWTNISMLLCQMILHGIFTINDAKNLHKQIYYEPSNPNPHDDWNPYSDLKYFIHDNFYFTEPIEIPKNFNDPEICEALQMPKTILDPKVTEIRSVSRLICVACVRSVFAQFKLLNDKTINGLSRWKSILRSVYHKEKKSFRETLEEDFKEYEYQFTENDVINYIK